MQCIAVCWFMTVQDPPVYMDENVPSGNSQFNGEMYKAYTKTGKLYDYIVWPVLYLHKGGPMISKGVAQGKWRNAVFSSLFKYKASQIWWNLFIKKYVHTVRFLYVFHSRFYGLVCRLPIFQTTSNIRGNCGLVRKIEQTHIVKQNTNIQTYIVFRILNCNFIWVRRNTNETRCEKRAF